MAIAFILPFKMPKPGIKMILILIGIMCVILAGLVTLHIVL